MYYLFFYDFIIINMLSETSKNGSVFDPPVKPILGEPRVQHFEMERQNETIDYNERFSWDSRGWLLFRAFFGPYGKARSHDLRRCATGSVDRFATLMSSRSK